VIVAMLLVGVWVWMLISMVVCVVVV